MGLLRREPRVRWTVPETCAACGARVDQARAACELDPRCPFCRQPIARQPCVPPVPKAMEALLERVVMMGEAVGVAVPEQLAAQLNALAHTPSAQVGSGSAPVAAVCPPACGAGSLGQAPGAQWVAAPGGLWWRWSWLDHQWQELAPPDSAPPADGSGWVHWVEGTDGGWTRRSSGAAGEPWPTPPTPVTPPTPA